MIRILLVEQLPGRAAGPCTWDELISSPVGRLAAAFPNYLLGTAL